MRPHQVRIHLCGPSYVIHPINVLFSVSLSISFPAVCDLLRLLDYAMPGRLLFANQLRLVLPGKTFSFYLLLFKKIFAGLLAYANSP